MTKMLKSWLKTLLPAFGIRAITTIRSTCLPENRSAILNFVKRNDLKLSLMTRLSILVRYFGINFRVECPHTMEEMLTFASHVLKLSGEKSGVIIEAGCFKGGSSAKFSIATSLSNRKLVVFDSFLGIPPNSEEHETNIFGGQAGFREGDYCGSIEEVQSNVRRFGEAANVRFVQGYFEESMPSFNENIAAAYIDVDLVSSTKICLKYLYPLLSKGGSIFSQDGHLPLVIELLDNDSFWNDDLGIAKPRMLGLYERKLVQIIKD